MRKLKPSSGHMPRGRWNSLLPYEMTRHPPGGEAGPHRPGQRARNPGGLSKGWAFRRWKFLGGGPWNWLTHVSGRLQAKQPVRHPR